METSTCPACGSGRGGDAVDLSPLLGVTSDCKPWSQSGLIYFCSRCGLIQKQLNESWREDCRIIYQNYEMYSQGDGQEQSIFLDDGAMPRSERLLSNVMNGYGLPDSGSLIDIGCGNGSFLKVAHRVLPKLKLTGVEWDGRHKAMIEAIPGVQAFIEFDALNDTAIYEVAVLIHALEHMEAPREILSRIARLLNDNGHLVIQVPDWVQNPLDLVIQDHAFHFSQNSLQYLLGQVGLRIAELHNDWVPKEISLHAVKNGSDTVKPDIVHNRPSHRDLTDGIGILSGFIKQCYDSFGTKPFYVFGSSIGAAWLASHFDEQITGWIDEDPIRQGRTFLNRPIHSPESADRSIPIAISLAPVVAKKVFSRMRNLGFSIGAVVGLQD
ncbi:MAG: hypothetical protein CBB94_15210 [Gammaproteobacteria bacterium TMED34]|nr:MAG: hypothetical protein CBB94_15210 [Gammaproteobacteria bacterium TMED34]